jgi:hypothetical protein
MIFRRVAFCGLQAKKGIVDRGRKTEDRIIEVGIRNGEFGM